MSEPMTLEETMAELIRIGAAGSACVEGSAFHWLTTLKAQVTSMLLEHNAMEADRDRLAEQVTKLRAAAVGRIEYGHNDICDHMLSGKYACSCGHNELADAFKETEPSDG